MLGETARLNPLSGRIKSLLVGSKARNSADREYNSNRLQTESAELNLYINLLLQMTSIEST